jgi:hypothetical protein
MAKLKKFKDVFIGDKVYYVSNDNTHVDVLKLVNITPKNSVLDRNVSQYEFDNLKMSNIIRKSLSKLVFEEDLSRSVIYTTDYNLYADKQQAINVLKNGIKEIQECINKIENDARD